MKKIIAVFLFIMLCGCSKQDSEFAKVNIQSETPAPAKTVIPENHESTPQPGTTSEGEQERQSLLLSEFSTKIYDKKKSRVNNIVLASDAINNKVVEKGAEFSFNETVGERSEKRGYKTAPILIGREKSQGIGGGVCQVSTTLYRAVKDAGLDILEFHHHEKKMAYAKDGDDATVNYGSLDFRFKNNSDSDIVISTAVKDYIITVQIWEK